MRIERAINTDSKALTELTIRSKSYWNYSSEQIEKWKDDLTISANYIDQNEVYKVIKLDQLVGYYSYFIIDEKKVKLDNMFLEPDYIGQGLGKVMMDHFFHKINRIGAEVIRLDSEPNAEKFYKKLGFIIIGQLESSIKNRFLPIMELEMKTIDVTNEKKD